MLWCRFGTLLFLKWGTISFEKENWKPTHSSLNFKNIDKTLLVLKKLIHIVQKKKETTATIKKYKMGLKEK